jgi:mannose/fructose/N-acetylgalactosamine-specific phosphotransferase system component IIC
VGHFNRIDARAIQRLGNLAHIVERVLMTNRVHPVAQGHVRDIEFFTVHAASPAASFIAWAIFSAVASAAEVIISRLPA